VVIRGEKEGCKENPVQGWGDSIGKAPGELTVLGILNVAEKKSRAKSSPMASILECRLCKKKARE